MVKTRSLYLTLSWNGTGTWHQDTKTDTKTYKITIANTRYSYASPRA